MSTCVRPSWPGVALVLSIVLMSACATKPAPEMRGRWQPVNQLADAPVAIPLSQTYIYAASPLDRTFNGMLARWARDARMTLSYLHDEDFTLYAPVSDIRTSSLQQAVSMLDSAYGPYGVSVVVDGGQIVVRSAHSSGPMPSEEASP